MTSERTVSDFNHQGAPEAFRSRLSPSSQQKNPACPSASKCQGDADRRHRPRYWSLGAVWSVTWPSTERLRGRLPVRQGSGEVALDVGVHDGLEVLEFAVLQEVDDVDLQNWNTITIHSIKYIFVLCFSFYCFSQINLRSIFARLFYTDFQLQVFLCIWMWNKQMIHNHHTSLFQHLTWLQALAWKTCFFSVCRLWLSFIH